MNAPIAAARTMVIDDDHEGGLALIELLGISSVQQECFS
jgi:hypothetical protein